MKEWMNEIKEKWNVSVIKRSKIEKKEKKANNYDIKRKKSNQATKKESIKYRKLKITEIMRKKKETFHEILVWNRKGWRKKKES